MTIRMSHRIGATAAPVVLATMLLGACGGSDSTASGADSIVPLNSGQTDYETIAPETTAPPATEASVPSSEPADGNGDDDEENANGGSTGGGATSDYVIKSGDIPVQVAEKFDVSFQDLQDANPSVDFTSSFPTGSTIKIPGGGSGSSDSGSSDSGSSDSGSESSDGGSDEGSTDTIPESGDNCSDGSYTIESGDIPNAVANDFGVSFDSLQAANPSIDFLESFPIGQEIVIPAEDDC